MGPPPFGDGDRYFLLSNKRAFSPASMGPPPFGDGDRPGFAKGHHKNLGFNGATAFRRWRCVCASWLRLRSMWALQWGHRLSAMEIGRASDTCWSRVRASMGPPPFGDGDPSPCRSWVYSSRLQWGHRLSAMEMSDGKVVVGHTYLLQWGHRLSAMEIRIAPGDGVEFVPASMGPPPFGDGDEILRTYAGVGSISASMGPPPFGDGDNLWPGTAWQTEQASMGPPPFGDGDCPDPMAIVLRIKRLQWGHRLSAMEILGPCLRVAHVIRASMGPPPFGDGDTKEQPLDVPQRGASMGPPPFGDGDAE